MSTFKAGSLPQRSSPFRRPASPSTPSSNPSLSNRTNTSPSTSRTAASPLTSPSKLKQSYTASEEEEEESMIITPTKSNETSSFHAAVTAARVATKEPASPVLPRHNKTSSFTLTSSTTPVLTPTIMSAPTSRVLPTPPTPASAMTTHQPPSHAYSYSPYSHAPGQIDALSKIPPALLHSLRESFSVLDSGSTGTVTPSSVHETLQTLGIPTSEVAKLFPAGQAQEISLPQYLSSLASALVALSPQQELLNAFSAFDDDDSGQIDVAELKRALLETLPEHGDRGLTERDIDEALRGFTGRRILGRSVGSMGMGMGGMKGVGTNGQNMNRRAGGDVFRYQEFVGNLTGGPEAGQQQGSTVAAR